PGWPRKQVKLAVLIAINATTEIEACRAIAEIALGLSPGWLRDHVQAARELLIAIRSKHPAIASSFGSDAGARLMRKDSDIAERVMLDMIRRGIPCLPVHDSFIVPATRASELEEAMEREIRRQNSAKLGEVASLYGTTTYPATYPQDGAREREAE